jgi:excisionase family DNA binding protein
VDALTGEASTATGYCGLLLTTRYHRSTVLPVPDSDFLTVAEFAKQVRVSEKTVRAAINRGEIPTLRLGARIRIPRSALETLAKRPA